MPIIGIILLALAFYLAVVSIIPLVASYIGMIIIGRRAKLEPEDTIIIGIQFYFITGAYGALYVLSQAEAIGFGEWISAIVLFLFWPIGVGISLLGMTTEDEWAGHLLFALGFFTAQMFAVIKVLKRARQQAEQ